MPQALGRQAKQKVRARVSYFEKQCDKVGPLLPLERVSCKFDERCE